jgi:hypothetical protein
MLGGSCGGRHVLRGSHTYSCATRHKPGEIVCGCFVTMNAAEAESAIPAVLEDLFTEPELWDEVVRKAHRRASKVRAERSRREQEITSRRR